MRLLFVILAHNQPEELLELADALTRAATDAMAIIHFDASASPDDFELLRKSLKDNKRIILMERRVRCLWGDYSLVEATLLALDEVRSRGHEFDYVTLLSGACLPCRPVKQFERYLTENFGREFIEANGPEWVVNGLREDRYTKYTLVPPLTRPRLESFLFKAQRFLKVERTLPAGIKAAYFGSQWWTLTWKTCLLILDFMNANPLVARFYRKTWIPDEMVFNTLVRHLTANSNIANFNLTHYQFTDHGKPTVHYDDHGEYPFGLNKFFYRKVSPEAKALRRRSLERAFEPDDGDTLEMTGYPNRDYEIKIEEQTYHPAPGQLYYQDQLAGMHANLLKPVDKPYVIVCGSLSPAGYWGEAYVRFVKKGVNPRTPLKPLAEPYAVLCDSVEAVNATVKAMDPAVFELVGRPFMRDKVDFGEGRDSFHDLKATDAAIRDLSPALYFVRILKRCEKIPVFLWMPGDNWSLLDIANMNQRTHLKEIRQW